VRELARVRGLVRKSEPLGEACAISPNPWVESWRVIAGLNVNLQDSLVQSFMQQPLPLLPTAQDRRPEADQIEHFVDAADQIAARLHLWECQAGQLALPLLLDAGLAVKAWPSIEEIETVEASEAGRVLRLLMDKTELGMSTRLAAEGYTEAEGIRLIGLAKKAAKRRLSEDPESDRAIFELRLQDALDRARQDGKLPAEVALLRLLASTQNLLQTGEGRDEEVDDMVRTARRITAGGESPRRQLPAPETEEPVEPQP
jgi:hypothetical protein